MNNHRKLLPGHLLALFTVAVWGTTFISSKLLLSVFQPLEILIFRFLLAWFLLFLCSPKPLIPKSLREELLFFSAGVTGLTLYFLLENVALTYTRASNVGIIISAAPMFTAVILWLFRQTPRPKATFFLGFLIAMSGIVLITLSGGDRVEVNPLGDLLTLGSTLAWAFYSLFMAMMRDLPYTNLQVTRKVFFWGLVCSVPLAPVLHLDFSLARFADPLMLGNMLFLAVVASATCYVTWNQAMRIIGTVACNVYVYLSPVITLAASALILGEPITPFAVGAIALILLGLWLSQWKGGGDFLAALKQRRLRRKLRKDPLLK